MTRLHRFRRSLPLIRQKQPLLFTLSSAAKLALAVLVNSSVAIAACAKFAAKTSRRFGSARG
jgi:hypothetical protein